MYIAIAIWLVLGLLGWSIAKRRHSTNRHDSLVALVPSVMCGAITFFVVIIFAKRSPE